MLVELTRDLVLPDTTEVRHSEPNTATYVRNDCVGKGTLYIAESQLYWLSDGGEGFTLEYPKISVHAISKDTENFPDECLYLMLDVQEAKVDLGDGDADSEDNDELRFVPDDKTKLESMYRALSACQILHPDPSDGLSDDEIEEDEEDADEEGEEPADDMNGGDLMETAPGQFDDA